MLSRCLVAAVLVATSANAGPLDPPPGPIAPTHKTLTQVEPRTPISHETTPGDESSLYRITAPGSYYLTGNIDGVHGKRGITIDASNVIIDLNGFVMRGAVPGKEGGGSLEAIGRDILADVSGVTVTNGVITDWRGGVLLTGFAARGSVVTGLSVRGSLIGISVPSVSVVRWCTVDDGGSSEKGQAGIVADGSSTIESCRVLSAFTEDSEGIWVFSHCIVRDCVVTGGGVMGIRGASSENLVERCWVSTFGSGIEVHSRTVVRHCVVSGTGGDAIAVIGTDNQIERNSVRSSTIGLHVTGSGNIMLANTASGNTTSFDIAAGNVGHFKLAATGLAFAGDGGGVAPSGGDSNTNYAY